TPLVFVGLFAVNIARTHPVLAGAVASPAQRAVEDVVIVRSVRESRGPATSFCARSRTGFENATNEDRFSLRAVVTTRNGVVEDARSNTVGSAHACYGTTADPSVVNFYGEGTVNALGFSGTGYCRLTPNGPENGLTLSVCVLDLRPTDEYVGGRLTSNTV